VRLVFFSAQRGQGHADPLHREFLHRPRAPLAATKSIALDLAQPTILEQHTLASSNEWWPARLSSADAAPNGATSGVSSNQIRMYVDLRGSGCASMTSSELTAREWRARMSGGGAWIDRFQGTHFSKAWTVRITTSRQRRGSTTFFSIAGTKLGTAAVSAALPRCLLFTTPALVAVRVLLLRAYGCLGWTRPSDLRTPPGCASWGPPRFPGS